MKESSVLRDYLVGTVLVLVMLVVSVLIIRFTNGGSSAQVNGAVGALEAPAAPAVMEERIETQAAPVVKVLSLAAPARLQELTGRFDPATHPDFVLLEASLTDGDGTYRLRREAAQALQRMVTAAAADGIVLQVRSATRNFNRQAQIWSAKWTGARTLSDGTNLGPAGFSDSVKARKILLYSSMPGTSRHHWGTDVDFNAFENEYFAAGKGLAEYTWLQEHAAEHGFFQPYTAKTSGRPGYEEERWHWSYAPLSVPMLSAYRTEVDYESIAGFPGAEVAQQVNAISEYVLGVNAELR